MTAALLVKPVIAEFAAAVRDALDDLTPEEVDDLTDGLEADLTEQSAEAPDFEPGDPVAYAAELRSAAGFPPRGAHPRRRGPRLSAMRDLRRRVRQGIPSEIRKLPLGSRALDFLGAIRPIGWLLRGWALSAVFWNFFPGLYGGGFSATPRSSLGWVLFFVSLIVSIQWGRDRWMPAAWLRAVRTIATVASIVAVPLLFAYLPVSVARANQVFTGSSEVSVARPTPSPDEKVTPPPNPIAPSTSSGTDGGD